MPETTDTAARLDLLTVGEDADWIIAFGHHNLVEFAVRAYDYARHEDLNDDGLAEAVIASRHTYARGPTPEDYADYEDEEERANALRNALDEDWLFWTDEPTDRPVTITGRLT